MNSNKNCFYLLNKPRGVASRKYVQSTLNLRNRDKFGIEGILDPFAEGLLIVATGYYTRFLPLFHRYKKEYIAELTLGISTDTLDKDGNISKVAEIPFLDQTKISTAMKNLTGSILQHPPAFSNAKVNGISARRRIRDFHENPNDILKSIKPREIEIEIFQYIEYNKPYLTFSAIVSAGTYIRTLAYDLAHLLDTEGHLNKLIRRKIGNIAIPKNKEDEYQCRNAYFLMKDMPLLILNTEQIKTLFYGQSLFVDIPDKSNIIFSSTENFILGYGEVKEGKVLPGRLIPQDAVFSK